MELAIRYILGLPSSLFLQLIIAELMFSGSMHRRARFGLRAWTSGTVLTLCSSLVFYFGYVSEVWLISNLAVYVAMFFMSLGFLAICFEEKFDVLLLCGASGYMTQHIASQFCQAFLTPSADALNASLGALALFEASNLPFFIAVYLVIWFIFARNSRSLEDAGSARHSLFNLSAATLAVVLVLSAVRDAYASESFALMVITRIFSVFLCLTLLYMRRMIIERRETENENELLREIGELREKQYAESRENIELINIKAHDMRHQLRKLQGADAKEIREIINIYDSAVKTSNETLDTLFTEKSIFCERHGITLSCMIDGDCLSFMTVGDICSIFGNALENAIEAVMELPREERMISFRVRERMGMVAANIDNNYAGTIELVDGLPKSTKGDDHNHGFGVKSIRRTAEKYGGEATVTVDDMFHLSILIPIPQEETQV